jgi:hypothetical protein
MLEVDIFGSGLGDLYYPSNAMDPYLKKNNVSSIPLLFYFAFCVLLMERNGCILIPILYLIRRMMRRTTMMMRKSKIR